MNQQLNLVLQHDRKIQKLGSIYTVRNPKDTNHLERRQQQPAIGLPMIKIALVYGNRKFSYGAVTYTLTDKYLRRTPYNRFTDARIASCLRSWITKSSNHDCVLA